MAKTVQFHFRLVAEALQEAAGRVYCDFDFIEKDVRAVGVQGDPEVVAAAMEAWWRVHGAHYIRTRLQEG